MNLNRSRHFKESCRKATTPSTDIASLSSREIVFDFTVHLSFLDLRGQQVIEHIEADKADL